MKKRLSPVSEGNRESSVITGFKAAFVTTGIRINILFLAITAIKNPFRGIRILKSVIKRRETVQGRPPFRKFIKAGHRYFISENIPGWPSAAFNSFFRAEIVRATDPGKRPPLSTIIFAITSRCRLGCMHCYEWNNISHIDKLTPANLKEVIIKVKEYGVNHIQLSGGEPLERFDDLTGLIRFAHKGIDLWLLTSGYGLTSENAFILKRAGLSGVDISLDHWDEAEHNRSRHNPKSFYWAKEAVENCKMAGLATTLSLCAFRTFVTYQNLVKYADLAKDWGVGFIRILEPRQAGRFTGMDITLGKDQTELLEKFFLEMNSSDKFIDFPVVTYPGYHQRRTGCLGAGNRYLYIDSVGEIHACPFCQQSAGNAVSGRFEEAVSLLKKYGCQKFEMNPS